MNVDVQKIKGIEKFPVKHPDWFWRMLARVMKGVENVEAIIIPDLPDFEEARNLVGIRFKKELNCYTVITFEAPVNTFDEARSVVGVLERFVEA